MIKDKAEALAAAEFHKGCSFEVGPKGGIKEHHKVWRKGKTQTWKTRPDEFTITCRFGLKTFDYFTENELGQKGIYTELTCPATIARKEYEEKQQVE